MIRYKSTLLDWLEATTILFLPTYLYGWKLGLLITSGLSSLHGIELALRVRRSIRHR